MRSTGCQSSLLVLCLGVLSTLVVRSFAATERSFAIENDVFIKDGKPFQIISGSVHYHRIHPAYWRDRLLRVRAMGLNTVELYVPWNFHNRYPGEYQFDGEADVVGFVKIIEELNMSALVRPGPYICAEWDFGGFPSWLASSAIKGGKTMQLRSDDATYLEHVDRWWNVLLPRLAPLLYSRGGPILMVQVENEYGFCGDNKDYLRHLVQTARGALGDEVMLFTTDPPNQVQRGSLYGGEVYSVVDFGAGWFDLTWAFDQQKAMNLPGQSPPFCSEFYTGWLTHWGEQMANTSSESMVSAFMSVLEFQNKTGSINLYMAHGGSNFGWWAGANLDGNNYMPHITSYDYDCPVSEAGDYGQPGIGGVDKFQLLRDAIQQHTGVEAPEVPPRPVIKGYGKLVFEEQALLMEQLENLFPGEGIATHTPENMEEYGMHGGLIVYRTELAAEDLMDGNATLEISAPARDFARVLVNGQVVAHMDRTKPANVSLGSVPSLDANSSATLDIIVEALGRQNFGCDQSGWDLKGIQPGSEVSLSGKVLRKWHVFPLELENLWAVSFGDAKPLNSTKHNTLKAGRRMLLDCQTPTGCDGGFTYGGSGDPTQGPIGAPGPSTDGPTFYRGIFNIPSEAMQSNGFPADTYLDTAGWGKGVAFVNGFNLGWYWATRGPQMTLYVPGPILKAGGNEVIILEVADANPDLTATFVDAPDFYGPRGREALSQLYHPEPHYFDRGAYFDLSPEAREASHLGTRAAGNASTSSLESA